MKRTYNEYVEGQYFGKCGPTCPFDYGHWVSKSYVSSGNGDSHVTVENNKVRESLGRYLNEVPTLESFQVLSRIVVEWGKSGTFAKRHPTDTHSVYNPDHPGYNLRNVLHHLFEDDDVEIDEDIFRYAFSNDEVRNEFMNTMVRHPSCPDDLVEETIKKNNDKFWNMTYRRTLLPEHIDLIVKRTKKCEDQTNMILHPNISTETLKYLSKNGRSTRVKERARSVLFDRMGF